MKWIFIAASFSLGFPLFADDIDKHSLEVFTVNYTGTHYLERKFEIGKASLTVSIDCQETEAAAKADFAKAVAAIEETVKGDIARLKLPEDAEKVGYDLGGEFKAEPSDPVPSEPEASPEDKRNRWKNRCTGEKYDKPQRLNKVYGGSKVVSIWYPNDKRILDDLEALATKIEGFSDEKPTGVKIKCVTGPSGKISLDVTKATREAAMAEIEKVATAKAIARKEADFALKNYQQFWPEGGMFVADDKGPNLPGVIPQRVNGKWKATLKQEKVWTVYSKRTGAKIDGRKGKLAELLDFPVDAESTLEEGFFATVIFTVTKDCQASKKDAEEITPAGKEIQQRLQKINGGKTEVNDQLKIVKPTGREVDAMVGFVHHYTEDQKPVYHYYNRCTLDTSDTSVKPKVMVWTATQSFTIKSTDLNAVWDTQDDIAKKYAKKIEDPNVTTVAVNWAAAAKREVLEDLDAKFQLEAFKKFLADTKIQCKIGESTQACLSQHVYGPVNPMMMARGMAAPASFAPVAPQGYTEAALPVDASERGMKPLVGTYHLSFTVQLYLRDLEAQLKP